MRSSLPATAVLAMALLGLRAWAHEPNVFPENGVFVPDDPTISVAVYGTFETGDEVFVIHFELAEPFALPVEILIPHREDLRDHRPAFAVVSPDLPPPADQDLDHLPMDLPEDAGVLVDLNQDPERRVFFESFSRRVFWSSTPVAVRLPEGSSEVWIWSPAGTTGDFVVGYGVEEGGDYLKACGEWSTYGY